VLFYHDNGAPPWGANGLNIFAHRLQSEGTNKDCTPELLTYHAAMTREINADRNVSIISDMAISSRRIVMLQSLFVILSHRALNLQHGEGTLGRYTYLGAKFVCGVYTDADIRRHDRRPNDMEYIAGHLPKNITA
jgi:hypothetical protein